MYGEPRAKPFMETLLLGWGFIQSRTAPSLRFIESQSSTQGFGETKNKQEQNLKKKKKKKKNKNQNVAD